MMFAETREMLGYCNLPTEDDMTLMESTKRFNDGAHFRIEVPTINSFG